MTVAAWLQANAALIPHQVAGVALLGVGAWLFGFHANAASTRHFAGFLIGYGASVVLSSIALPDPAVTLPLVASAAVAFFYGTVALVLCVLAFPRPLAVAVESKWAMLLPAVVATLAAGVIAATDPLAASFAYAVGVGNVIVACALAVSFVRLGREPRGEGRRSLLLLVVGLSLQETYFTTYSVLGFRIAGLPPSFEALMLWGNVLALVIVLAGAAALLPALRSTEREKARAARLALATVPIAAATGVLSAAYASNAWIANLGSVWRLAFAALVTWGILRHQFLGVDLRVRWAIGKSTVAAAFVAAFFVASEGAQILFGQGNEWVGVVGAGALVFALAPLQRAAERLAERAVPVAGERTSSGASSREERFRNAVRLALRGGLSGEEEVELFRLAEALGVPAGRAMEIRREMEGAVSEVGP